LRKIFTLFLLLFGITAAAAADLRLNADEFVARFNRAASGGEFSLSARDKKCHRLNKGGIECIFALTPLLNLSCDSASEGSNAQRISLVAGLAADDPHSILNFMAAAAYLVQIISPELMKQERGEIVLTMIKEATKGQGGGRDVRRGVGNVNYTMNIGSIFAILSAEPM
jgi:hypothetical protein